MLLSGVGRVGDPSVYRLWVVEGVGGSALDWRGERSVQHCLGHWRGRQVVAGLLPPGQAGHDQVLLALPGPRARGPVLQDHSLGVHGGGRHG